MYNNRIRYSHIEQREAEAASKSIYKTIEMVELAVGIEFPRGGTPSESRQIMIDIIASRLR